ncbi:MAG: PqqD family peptide modification chaperone [Acutalibacteraceae bacterium]|nr:PqqD family peptide modification chaperone [Acutalibacteraceae bacterium]
MRIKDGFSLKNFEGQYTVVSDNGELENTIVLTDTVLFLWNLLKEKNASKTEMLNALLSNFDISTVLALGNIDVFLRTMKENGIIED